MTTRLFTALFYGKERQRNAQAGTGRLSNDKLIQNTCPYELKTFVSGIINAQHHSYVQLYIGEN